MGAKDLKTGLSSRDTDIKNIFTKGIEFVVHSLARDVCITNINNLFLIFLNYNIRKVDTVARVTTRKEIPAFYALSTSCISEEAKFFEE